MVGYPAFLSDKALSAEDEQTLERVLHGGAFDTGSQKIAKLKTTQRRRLGKWMRNGVADTVSLNALLQPWP
jgi:hypothetical protein